MKKCIFKMGHISDAHLGFRQYGLGTRREDFRKAFDQCIQRCIVEEVNVVLFCGDTFHNEKPDFYDLIHLRDNIQKLRDADIDVLAITGNHDKSGYSDYSSWIDLFNVGGLDPEHQTTYENYLISPVLYKSYNKTIAVFGLNWDRDVEQKVLTQVLPVVEEGNFDVNILALHAGLANVYPQDRGLISDDFVMSISKNCWKHKKGDPAFDYVALGHIHKPYIRFDAHNPGSLERCSSEEWDYVDRGMFIVEFFDDGSRKATKYCPTNRPGKKIRIPVSMNTSQEHINKSAAEKLMGMPDYSLIYIELFGSVGEQIPTSVLSDLKAHIYSIYRPLYIKVKDSTYVSKPRASSDNLASTTVIGEVFKEVFGGDEEIAVKVVEAVTDGKEVSQIINIVEDYVKNNEDYVT